MTRGEVSSAAGFDLLPEMTSTAAAWSDVAVFYIVIFSLLAVLLVFAGVSMLMRRRKQFEAETRHSAATSNGARRQRKQKRAQSRQDRRKRH
jgi:hypothetical protein